MAGYAGVRRKERRKLNSGRSVTAGGLTYGLTANRALERVVREMKKELRARDKRTAPNKLLQAAVKRLEILRREVSR